MTFNVGEKVVWLYWPRSSAYSYWQRVNGEVVKVGKNRLTLKVQDKDGGEHLRHVKIDNVLSMEQFDRHPSRSDHLHGDGSYPLEAK